MADVIERGHEISWIEPAATETRLAQQHVDISSDRGQRRAQLVRCIADETLLSPKRSLQAIEHCVEGPGEAGELVVRRGDQEAGAEGRRRPISRGNRGGGGGDAVHWSQSPTGQDPAAGEGERESQCGRHQKHLSQDASVSCIVVRRSPTMTAPMYQRTPLRSVTVTGK